MPHGLKGKAVSASLSFCFCHSYLARPLVLSLYREFYQLSCSYLVLSMGIGGSMAQAQPNPQVNAMCANIAAQLYPLGIQAMPNVQAEHEEIQKITTTLGDLNHGVKRNDFRFLGSAQRFRVLCKNAVLFVRCKVLISGPGLGAVQDPVFSPDFKHWIF